MNISWEFNFGKLLLKGKLRTSLQHTRSERNPRKNIQFSGHIIAYVIMIWALSTSNILATGTPPELIQSFNSSDYSQDRSGKIPEQTSSQIAYVDRAGYENCALADSIVFPAAKARVDGIPRRTAIIQSEKDRQDRLAAKVYNPVQVNSAYNIEMQVLDFVYSIEPASSPAQAVQLWNDQCASKYHYHPIEDSSSEDEARGVTTMGEHNGQESRATHIFCKLRSSRTNASGAAPTLERNYTIDYDAKKVNGTQALISIDEIKFKDGIYLATINRYSSTAFLTDIYGTIWQGACEIMRKRAF